jgi:hypothetical protein
MAFYGLKASFHVGLMNLAFTMPNSKSSCQTSLNVEVLERQQTFRLVLGEGRFVKLNGSVSALKMMKE